MFGPEGRSVARRMIAAGIMAVWLVLIMISVMSSFLSIWWPDLDNVADIAENYSDIMTHAVMVIVGAPYLDKIVKSART